MSEAMPTRTATALIAAGLMDAGLAALLWTLLEAEVPLVVGARAGVTGPNELRAALSSLAAPGQRTADGVYSGGTIVGGSLEDVLRFGGANPDDTVPDTARELGIVIILSRPAADEPIHVAQAHYVRPIERDAAGHIQRRPPALLSAWNDETERLDHFYWAINDELATRVDMEPSDFDATYRHRARLLADLVSAGVFDAAELRHHVETAALVEAGAKSASQADARN